MIPGGLSAWMRQMYPDLVTGAISSSGGPMQVINKTNKQK
jgi:hypothetical protein